MYEESRSRITINWLSLIIKLVLLTLFVFLLCWIFTKTDKIKTTNLTKEMKINNISLMQDAGLKYFTAKHLPNKMGENKKLSLAEMINKKLVTDFTNQGKICNTKESYIKVTKANDNDYALKINLNCGKNNDFIVTTIQKEK